MKKKFLKFFVSISSLCCVFALGLFFGLNSWDKNLYVQWNPSQSRGIAGVDSSSTEVLNLSYDQLIQEASEALFSRNQIVEEENLMAFYLGNFLTQDPNLKKHRFICQIFPLVEFSFTAVGVHLNGEESLMILQSPCNMKDEDFIGPFWIPKKEILSNFSKKAFELKEQQSFIRFYNASIALNPSWLLKSVRFFDENQEESEFLIRFTPGDDKPYFELNLKNNKEK